MDVDFGRNKSGQNLSCRADDARISQRRQKRRSLTRFLMASIAAVMVSGSTGCSSLSSVSRGVCDTLNQTECINDFMISHRNRVMAAKAWYREADCHCQKKHLKEFREGFIQGYIDVAEGGDGCTPAVAPAAYWGWQYQSPNGQAAVNAWFAGYPLGVKAAEQDGIIHWGEIRPMGYNVPAAESYPTQPYGAAPIVIHDENGVPMLNQPGVITENADEGDEDSSVPESPSDAGGATRNLDPLNLEDASDAVRGSDAPNSLGPGADDEAIRAIPPNGFGSVQPQDSNQGMTARVALNPGNDLVPSDSTMTYSLNDGAPVEVDGNNMIEEIFGGIELPESTENEPADPNAQASTDGSSSDAVDINPAIQQSSGLEPTETESGSAPVKTAEASDDLPFKFE